MTALEAVRATGLLAEFGAAGVLSVADVQVASRLGALGGEHDEQVLLAVALTVRSTRQGSVAFDVTTAAESVAPDDEGGEPVALAWPSAPEWLERCAGSPLIGTADDDGRPVRMLGHRLWLTRYWKQEAVVAAELIARMRDRPSDLDRRRLDDDLDALFPAEDDVDQRTAAALAATSRACVIAGGPGTGKTTTVARLITALLRQLPELRVALAAPTGKAAARLGEAVHDARDHLDEVDVARLARLSAGTLHRLLGRRPGRASRFAHDRDNRLPYDVIVVDESSMVSLTMMARLLEAVPPAARLVLVGDPDQLASVEAGAVLADLVPERDPGASGASGSVAFLRRVRRFGRETAIAELADRVRAGAADDVVRMLEGGSTGIAFHAVPDDAPVTGPALDVVRALVPHELALVAAGRAEDVNSALGLLDEQRLLCAHRGGPRGERFWSAALERWLVAGDPTLAPRLDGLYAGQPLLVTANDYENELYNGDTGVVVQRGDELVAAFRRAAGAVLVPLARLGAVRPLHAITIHRAQGSQFTSVVVLVPPATSPLATRQTLYTALTRATTTVTLIGSPEAVRACVERPVTRATGLRDRLAGGFAQDG